MSAADHLLSQMYADLKLLKQRWILEMNCRAHFKSSIFAYICNKGGMPRSFQQFHVCIHLERRWSAALISKVPYSHTSGAKMVSPERGGRQYRISTSQMWSVDSIIYCIDTVVRVFCFTVVRVLLYGREAILIHGREGPVSRS